MTTPFQRALVIGASGGIGAALAAALTARGVALSTLSRRADGLDVTSDASVGRALAALEPGFDLVICATGILAGPGRRPEKALKELTPGAMAEAFAVNAIGPAMVLKHARPLLARDRRAVIACLSARVGSIGDNRIGGWHAYRASKAALNQVVRGAAIELGRSHPRAICVALHPGTVATDFTARYAARHATVPPDEAAARLLAVIEGLGPGDSGGFRDQHAEVVPW